MRSVAQTPPAQTTQQLDLFAAERWPRKPYAKAEKDTPKRVRPLDIARQHPYIQPNHPSILWRLPFDLDRAGAAADWDWWMAPPPSWTVTNPATGHAHIAYEIEIPVARDLDHSPAMRLAAAVEHGLGATLGADPAYAGDMIQTPGHERWRTVQWRDVPYDLTELAEWVPQAINDRRFRDRRHRIPDDYAIGRNVALFEGLRAWAYRAVRDYWAPDGEPAWRDAVREHAQTLNAQFSTPLDPLEVGHTAKSVARWVWSRFTPQGFSAAQARRGRRSGEVRRRGSDAEQRPWERMGISRATYYRRKRAGKV